MFAATVSVFMVCLCFAKGDYQSAGCSDEGCGIPCYLRPSEDDCHYIDHNPCGDNQPIEDVEYQLRFLNESLIRLQEKLIQNGVIPAGNTCPPLHPIRNGGVIYSDLLLSPGVSAVYVCENGYSLHGHGHHNCTIDGVWTGDTTEIPVCQESLVICKPLVAIPYGHVHYDIVDTTLIQPGDIVTYECEQPYLLKGVEYRVCFRNGSWSEEEPRCIEPTTATPSSQASSKGTHSTAISVGVIVPFVAVVIVALTAAVILYIIRKKRLHKRAVGYRTLPGKNETDGHKRQAQAAKEVEGEPLVETSLSVETVHDGAH